jgi:hypothetical protein
MSFKRKTCIRDRKGETAWHEQSEQGRLTTRKQPAVCIPVENKFPADFYVLSKYLRFVTVSHPDVRGHVLDFLQDLILYTGVNVESMNDILAGAFTVLDGDRGSFYRKYKQYAYARIPLVPVSSHGQFLSKQFRMGAGSLVHCPAFNCEKHEAAITANPQFDILFGICNIVPCTGDSAFQFERSRMDSMASLLTHGADYLAFKKEKRKNKDFRNIGCFGTSPHTDSNPFYLPATRLLDD